MRGGRFIACRTAELVEPRTELSRGVAAPHPTATGWTAAEGGGLRLRGYHPDELFARADAALYVAKHGGRNRVVADAPAAAMAGAIRRHL